MKKQMLITFTKLCLTVLMTIAAMASARAQSSTIRADIPFDFNIGGETLPAGTYTIGRLSSGAAETLLIRNRAGEARAIQFTSPVQARVAPAQAKLIFHRYGSSYFLAEVWTDGEDTGRRLLKSRSERRFERELATHTAQGAAADRSAEMMTKVILAAAP